MMTSSILGTETSDDAFVPCSYRLQLDGKRSRREVVSLRVGHGDHSEVLDVNLSHLRNTSQYFHDQLSGSSGYFVVPNSSRRLFRIYIDFLNTGNLRHPESDKTTTRRFSFGMLIDIFQFAKEFGITSLRNATLDEFFLRILDNLDELPYKHVYDIYNLTSPDSSLRSLVVDIIVNIGLKRDMQEWKDDLPKEFMTDCLIAASEDCIVPFSGPYSDDEVSDWLQEKKGEMCEIYHVHDFETRTLRQGGPHAKRKQGSGTGSGAQRIEKRRLKLAAEAAEAAEEAEQDEEEEEEEDAHVMDPDMQRIFDAESEARMKYLLESFPSRERY